MKTNFLYLLLLFQMCCFKWKEKMEKRQRAMQWRQCVVHWGRKMLKKSNIHHLDDQPISSSPIDTPHWLPPFFLSFIPFLLPFLLLFLLHFSAFSTKPTWTDSYRRQIFPLTSCHISIVNRQSSIVYSLSSIVFGTHRRVLEKDTQKQKEREKEGQRTIKMDFSLLISDINAILIVVVTFLALRWILSTNELFSS